MGRYAAASKSVCDMPFVFFPCRAMVGKRGSKKKDVCEVGEGRRRMQWFSMMKGDTFVAMI